MGSMGSMAGLSSLLGGLGMGGGGGQQASIPDQSPLAGLTGPALQGQGRAIDDARRRAFFDNAIQQAERDGDRFAVSRLQREQISSQITADSTPGWSGFFGAVGGGRPTSLSMGGSSNGFAPPTSMAALRFLGSRGGG